ncbi:hypothetical protein [Rhodoferax aquaticus]|uniref:Uncharacterized protein n=1 Tax=Rhodoferax aquaticus TaxID=2527691 RepID=A0A515ERX1_9BURK|nr:hypothetical protein [Rhodoferax aquaticus]QDL55363.1 hypothetical protein EXZ61_14940 [Rhodoferax aquaticus]
MKSIAKWVCQQMLWNWIVLTLTFSLTVALIRLVANPFIAWIFAGNWEWSSAELTASYLLGSTGIALIGAVSLTCHHWYQLGRESKAVKWLVIIAIHAATLALVFGVINPAIKKLAKTLVSL